MSIVAPVVEPRIADLRVTESEITAYLVDGRTVSVPLAWSWRLSEATPVQRLGVIDLLTRRGMQTVSLAPGEAQFPKQVCAGICHMPNSGIDCHFLDILSRI